MIKRKYILLLLTCLLSCFRLYGQDILANPYGNINVKLKVNKMQSDSLILFMQVDARKLSIKSDQSLILDVKLANGKHVLSLPSVLFTGSRREGYDRRLRFLAGMSPVFYRVVRGVELDKLYLLDYRIRIPYMRWMEGALVNITEIYHDCCDPMPIKEYNLALENDRIELADLKVDELIDLNTNQVVDSLPTEEMRWTASHLIDLEDNESDNSNLNEPAQKHSVEIPWARMVSIIEPENEFVKKRNTSISINIDYPVNGHKVLAGFGQNAKELAKIDSLMNDLYTTGLVELESIYLTSYASPEGPYIYNENLSKQRSYGFRDYLSAIYGLDSHPITMNWIAEDWDGLVSLIHTDNVPNKQEVLRIISETDIFNGREIKLMELDNGNPYRYMLHTLFPMLRRLEMKVNYIAAEVPDDRVKELSEKRPDLFSHLELFRLASGYDPTDRRYMDLIRRIAKVFSKDMVAQNNAAAVCLMRGDLAGAEVYLDKLGNLPLALINQGIFAGMKGDIAAARAYFTKAMQDGIYQGEENLLILESYISANENVY